MTKRRRRARRFAATAAGAAAVTAITGVLEELWRAAWRIGWDAALRMLGDAGTVHDARSAQSLGLLDELTTASLPRARRAARTRLRYLETVLASATPGATTVDQLAAQITAELASEPLALRLTLTETTWAVSQATLAAYGAAGATTVAWETDGDPCAECAANAAEGFIPAGVPFTAGAHSPPQHPNCACRLVPGATRGWSPATVVT